MENEPSLLRLVLEPFSVAYGALARIRLALYQKGVLHTYQVNAPVISVGNITAGGTGKTTLVEWIARVLARDGRRICILTRGYRRASAQRRVIVSDGKTILAGAREAGDEARLLAEALADKAAVISDADRLSAACWAMENLGSELFILDDGFQHLRLARNLNIAIVDATNPWGGGLMLPAGRLREPLSGLERAECIVVTRADQASGIDSLRRKLDRMSGGAPIFCSRMTTSAIRPLGTKNLRETSESRPDLKTMASPDVASPVAAFCAVGNPQSFFANVRNNGHALCYTRAFRDHHPYQQRDVDMLARESIRRGARALLTTAKDAVKLRSLRFDLPCYVVEIEIEIENEHDLLAMIHAAANRRATP